MDRQLHLHLKPSSVLRIYCFILLLLAIVAIMVSGLHALMQLLLVIVTVVWVVRCDDLCRFPLIQSVHVSQGKWQLGTRTGTLRVQLCPDTVVTYSITVLHCVDEQGFHHRIVVLPDSSDAESLRQLRVLLLQGKM